MFSSRVHLGNTRRNAAALLIAAGISLAGVNALAATDANTLTTPESVMIGLNGATFDVFGNNSSDGNLTTREDTREFGLGLTTRNWQENGLSEHLFRRGSLRPDRFAVTASSTRLSPALGLRGTTVKQVVRNALKFRFVWNWEKGKTTIQLTKGSFQTIGILDDRIYRDDVIRLKQTYRLGRWNTRMSLALGRFDQPGDAALWREETVTASFGISGHLDRMAVNSKLTVRNRRRAHFDRADYDISTGWKLTSGLNFSDYLWKKAAPGERPNLSLTLGAYGNDPDAVGAETYRNGVEYQIGFRASQKF